MNKSATIEEVAAKNYVHTTGSNIGLAEEEEEDDFDFTEHFTKLKIELEVQMEDEKMF